MASNRVSHSAAQPSQAASAVAIARLNEKKKEFEAVSALERASALFLQRVEGLGDDCDILADAGQAHGQVLAQWPSMFRILDMFLADRAAGAANTGDDTDPHETEGQRLVRISIDELQSAPSQLAS